MKDRYPIVITIPGEPSPKGTARFHGHAYTPKKTRTKEGIVASLAMDAMAGRPPIEGPVSMSITAVLPIPESWPKKRKAAALAQEEAPAKRPDLTNLIKLAEDSLNGIVYRDDAQIVALSASKRYGPDPRTVIIVYNRTAEMVKAA